MYRAKVVLISGAILPVSGFYLDTSDASTIVW